MRFVLPLAAIGALAAASPAFAQDPLEVGVPLGVTGDSRIYSPGQLGITATTPSRIAASSREMNRGRRTTFHANMTPTMAKTYAEQALHRAGYRCEVAESVVIGQTRDGAPLVEVDCSNGGGLVIADSNPIVASDCLDLSPEDALSGRNSLLIDACRLPGNVSSVAATRDAEAQNVRN